MPSLLGGEGITRDTKHEDRRENMKKTILALGLAASLSAFSLTADAANAQNTTDYIMCPGDVLQVIVYGHEDLSTPMG